MIRSGTRYPNIHDTSTIQSGIHLENTLLMRLVIQHFLAMLAYMVTALSDVTLSHPSLNHSLHLLQVVTAFILLTMSPPGLPLHSTLSI